MAKKKRPKQAQPNVSKVPNQQKRVNLDTAKSVKRRLSSIDNTSGVRLQRADGHKPERNKVDDLAISEIQHKLAKAQQNLDRQKTADNSQRKQAEITRALQNLQRRCNHLYNLSTKRCEYCNKHKDSHVYDT